MTNVAYISKHKRLREYDEIDYKLVTRLIEASSGILFCPNVLTETSNLIRYIDDPIRTEISLVFSQIIERTDEQYIQSVNAIHNKDYARLGLTDAVLLSLSTTESVLVTADLSLWLAAIAAGQEAINYNHYRDEFRADFN